jgi:hypothetical protein
MSSLKTAPFLTVALHYEDHGTAGILKESLDLNPGETTTVKVKIQEVCGFDTYMHVHTYLVKGKLHMYNPTPWRDSISQPVSSVGGGDITTRACMYLL